MAMDQLRAMRIFVRVIDEGSFSGAARELDMAPPAVTRAIAELETHLGCRLIHRTTRRLTLTDIGAEYLERVRPLLVDLDDADALATAATGQVQGRLRLTGPASFLGDSLLAGIAEFQRLHPRLTVQLNASPPLEEPDEKADITFLVHGPEPLDGDFVARPLARTEVLLCAAPAYLDAHGRPRTPEDLMKHQLLAPDVALVRRQWEFERRADGDRRTVPFGTTPVRITSASPELVIGAVRHGLGITGALSLAVAEDLRTGQLEHVLPEWRAATYRLYAAMPTGRHLPLRVRAFVDFLAQRYGGDESDPWLPAIAPA
ncbi:LysR family transcriptional regulator [Piscinibacter gummiphilus]|nr:LysR family transcriptional regulator [Piscinibacter gummiphilus]GLS98297.1 LysR family transcriptional regulator [Piscinibacter gummiphilus]